MNPFSRFFNRSKTNGARSFEQYLPRYIAGGYFTSMSDTGATVSEETALTASTVWGAIQCIADAFATLPVHVLNQKGGKEMDHPLYRLIHDNPNEYMTGSTFRHVIMVNVLLWGNAYAVIERDVMGRPTGLYPLRSRDTKPGINCQGHLVYEHKTSDGKTHVLRPDQVLHIMGMSLDGIVGLSPIQYAKATIGLSLALTKFASKFYGNGAQLGGVIEAPPMDDEAMEVFLAGWKKKHSGLENAFNVAMLPGMRFHPTSVDPDKSQALESRAAQVVEIARIFKVPPHKLADLSRATWNNIEHMQLEFMQETLLPWTVRFEEEADRKLLLEREKSVLEVKVNLDAVLRADTKTRMESYKLAIEAGVMTRNEARIKENMPPIKGGDDLLMPLNMTAVGSDTSKGKTAKETLQRDDPAVLDLMSDTVRHLLTIEKNALDRLVKKHQANIEDFRTAVTGFYRGHAEKVAARMRPALRVVGNDTNPQDYAAEWCSRHQADILDAAKDLLLPAFQDTIDSFTERAAGIALLTANPEPKEKTNEQAV